MIGNQPGDSRMTAWLSRMGPDMMLGIIGVCEAIGNARNPDAEALGAG